MSARLKFYREQAERSRELAKRARDEEIELHLLGVAEQYEKLAEEEEIKSLVN